MIIMIVRSVYRLLMRKIIIIGAGQNLVARLKWRNDLDLVGIDKHKANIRLFRKTHLNAPILEADIAQSGPWIDSFVDAATVVINQAQIGGRRYQDFEANNVTATGNILAAMRVHSVPYLVGVSSSAVNSKADDFYTRSKNAQEGLYAASTLPHVILRPTLIDISGLEKISYCDLIAMLHDILKPRARIIQILYALFWALLWLYEKLDRNPPFTTSQLEALVIPETFPVIDWPKEFGTRAPPLERALAETYLDPAYSPIILAF